MKSKIRIIQSFTIFLLAVFQSNFVFAKGLLDSSYLIDSYEKKGAIEEKGRFFIVDAQVIQGRTTGEQKPIKADIPFVKTVASATVAGSKDAFIEKGYRAHDINDSQFSEAEKNNYYQNLEALWNAVTRYSNEGKYKKRNLLPYSIKSYTDKIDIFKSYDAVVFVQCYGEYHLNKNDVRGVAVDAAAGAAFYAATQVLSISTLSYADSLDYKVSVYDVQSGELIWYREGTEADSDPRSKGRIMDTFSAMFNWHLPKSKYPQVDQKFKTTRSQLLNQRKGDDV